MIFQRKIEKEIEEWYQDSRGTSALLIEGARRVGKTTICEQFAKKHFKQYLIIDFNVVDEDTKKLFRGKDKLDDFFRKLFLYMNSPVLERGSLIIFDEIQFCIEAREKIKQLVKDGRYVYIETGSLISIKENSISIQIPSEEFPISMYPMDYEEFLWAIGKKEEADFIRDSYSSKSPIDKATHKRLMESFITYMAVGGMPSVVSAYIQKGDYRVVERRKKEILALYENDLRKIDAKYGTNTKRAYDLLPLIASRQRYVMPLSLFGIDPRTGAFSNNVEKIDESRMFNRVEMTTSIEASLSAGIDPSKFKLFHSDIGLALSHTYGVNIAEARSFYKKFLLGELRSNMGYIYECLVAQMLQAAKKSVFYTSWAVETSNQEGASYLAYFEVDFLYAVYGKVQPVEVKAGKWRTIESSMRLRAKYPGTTRKPMVISARPNIEETEYSLLPLYMVFCLEQN